MGSFQKAIAIYKQILAQTDNATEITQKCLQYLVVICKQIGDPEMERYQRALDDLILVQTQTENETQQQQQQQQQPALMPPPQQRHQEQRREEEDEEEDEENDWANVQLDDELLPS